MSAMTGGLLAVLGAPMLLLAAGGWLCWAAYRRVCAVVAPRPVESEWDDAVSGVRFRPFDRLTALSCVEGVSGGDPETGNLTADPSRAAPRRRPIPCAEPWLVN